MRIFIGSSHEHKYIAEDIAGLLKELDIDAFVWSENTAFIPGQHIIDELIRHSESVDAAIFIFAADDKVYRKDVLDAVRDNVLIEYGLFCGKLSVEKVIFLTFGNPHLATDLSGITYIDLRDNRDNVKERLRGWINRINPDGEKINKIDIGFISPFDEKGYADRIYDINSGTDKWTEIGIDYTIFNGNEPAFSGLVICNNAINISFAQTAIIEIEFEDKNLNTIAIEFKNHKKNLMLSKDIKPDDINDNRCTIDISGSDTELTRCVDEIVLCTKPGHFSSLKQTRFKIRSISFE